MTSNNLKEDGLETRAQERIAELEKTIRELRSEIFERARSEEALRKSVERYRTLFNSIEEGFSLIEVILDDKGKPVDYRILETNKSLEKIIGFRDIVGKRVRELIPNVEDNWIESFGKVALTGDSIRLEGWSGAVKIWFEVYASRIGGKESQKVAIIFKDITERKQTEEALENAYNLLEQKVKERTVELENAYNSLKESEKSLAEAQKLAHVGSYDWDIITNEEYWSDELYRIFGLDPQPELNHNMFLKFIHPEDLGCLSHAINGALNGKPYHIDYRIILPDGEERTIYSQGGVIFDEKNKPIRMRGIVQDITEYKKAEEKLRESEEKYRNIVETANEVILITDKENVITYVNKKIIDMLGYTLEEVVGKPIWGFISEECRPVVKMNLEQRAQNISGSYELKLIRKDGSPLWTLLNAKPLLSKDGKYLGAMSMLTDITERKKAEEALANIEIARKKEIHHRIKNNLQVISSLLDLQAEKFKNRECVKDSEIIEAFKESQDRIISMALIHEELYKGEEFETLNFSLYIKELAENLFNTYKLEDIDITLNMDLEEDLFFDMDTAVPLGMIINELVSNSLKYAFSSRDKGEIRIRFHREGDRESKNEGCKSTIFTLIVSDNGVGIPENLDIEEIDSLGLQLVTSLVDQLDGEFELKRDNGTEFIIKFTVTEKDNSASNPANN